jgi:hypothetical protein
MWNLILEGLAALFSLPLPESGGGMDPNGGGG